MMKEDTISAISTAIGEAGIGIVRMSGDHAIEIADKIFKAANGKALTNIRDRQIIFGHILDSDDNIIDEAIVFMMRAPKSYTREDVVEFQCHGNAVVLQKVLQRTIEVGARLAERGEFTKRAFLNGRLDLSQAQAVLDVIQAKTDKALKMAEGKLFGKISSEIYELKQQILSIIANIEAVINFPEDDINDVDMLTLESNIDAAINNLSKLIKIEAEGTILREGIETVIIGKPNVGKSSLLNFLSKRDKAIVTDIPGTTRDVIEEYINIEGIPLKIVDTAGIRNSNEKIEQMGIEKSKLFAEKAALILVLFDVSREIDSEDEGILDFVKDKKVIVLLTKSDLPVTANVNLLKKYFSSEEMISISVKSGIGMKELSNKLLQKISDITGELNAVKSTRELAVLNRIDKHLHEAKNTLKSNLGIDLISIDLCSALEALNELTGESINEDIINEIFTKFCVGK